jgi:hypothetical protein
LVGPYGRRASVFVIPELRNPMKGGVSAEAAATLAVDDDQ